MNKPKKEVPKMISPFYKKGPKKIGENGISSVNNNNVSEKNPKLVTCKIKNINECRPK